MSSPAAIIGRELALVERFLAALLEEQALLRRGATEGLDALVQVKAELARDLNAASAEREVWLSAQDTDAGRRGMEAWLARHPEDEVSRQAWQALIARAEEAQTANALNGQLIAQRLHTTHQALAILSAESPAAGLYGRDGQSALGTGSRIIDSA